MTLVKRLSGATPFRNGCGVPGEDTPASEAEPHLAVDPRNARHLVATWQQDRFPVDGGSLGNLVAVTHDGGRSWRVHRPRRISRCDGGRDERASDPWLAISPGGLVHLASLTFTETPPGAIGAAGPTSLVNSVSRDAGASFADPVFVADEGVYDDREQVTADPNHPRRAYFVWVRRLGVFGESGVEYFARTDDGGRHWSAPRPIQNTLPDPTLLEVLPNGTLLNLYLVASGTAVLHESNPAVPLVPWRVMSTRSTDGGRTWSQPVEIGTIEHPVAPRRTRAPTFGPTP